MKNLLSIAAVAALLTTGAIADNTVGATGGITAKAVVSFSSAAGESYHATDAGRFVDANIPLGGITGDITRPLYVKTNINGGQAVHLKVTGSNNGFLTTPLGDQIQVAYKVGTALATVPAGAPISLPADRSGATASSSLFTISPLLTGNEVAGNYSELLTMLVTVQ